MPRKFMTEKQKKAEKILYARYSNLPYLPKNAIRSIAELARVRRLIPGIGFGYLSPKQQKWLSEGGYELFAKAKPRLAVLVKELMEARGEFKVNLSKVALELEKRLGFKVSPSEVEAVLRFKRDPFYCRGERMEKIAEALTEVLKKESVEGQVAELWSRWCRKAKTSPFSLSR